MKDKNVWQLIYDCLQKDTPVALLIVVESEGSTPGRVGFKMALTADGTSAGTIGGGTLEYKFLKKAQANLKNGDSVPVLQRQIHNPEATTNRSGMICGGMQTIVLYPCQKTELATLQHLVQSLENRERGTLQLSPAGMSFTPNQHNAEHYQFRFESENDWLYKENVGLMNTAYIIGGGHVGLALSRILAMLDFYSVVLDERPNINTFKNNTAAHEKITVSYQDIQQHIPDGSQNYAIIMTHNHQTDKRVLRQLLDKKLRYLGMMGSASKVNEIFEELRQEGVSPARLQQLYAPIGLSIKSQTPTEIAISIAAEIIAVKNNGIQNTN
jgi:xanthine dehydrogenase accessory factor